MEIKEAISRIEGILDPYPCAPSFSVETCEALEIAIGTLKTQLSTEDTTKDATSDLISRQAAIDTIHNLYAIHGSEGSWIDQRDAFNAVNNLPSAQPEPKWIPVSEMCPKENCRCLTTNKGWGSFEVDWNAWIDGKWLYPNEKPIAWMPLPEPYQSEAKRKTDE